MEEYARQLGADCPFFIQNKPIFAEGTGNIFSPLNISLQDYKIVIVKPDIFISTKDTYAKVKPKRPSVPLVEIIGLPISEWKENLTNDFESGIFAKYPEIGEIKKRLYTDGAIYASMSGSGSAVYGVFG